MTGYTNQQCRVHPEILHATGQSLPITPASCFPPKVPFAPQKTSPALYFRSQWLLHCRCRSDAERVAEIFKGFAEESSPQSNLGVLRLVPTALVPIKNVPLDAPVPRLTGDCVFLYRSSHPIEHGTVLVTRFLGI